MSEGTWMARNGSQHDDKQEILSLKNPRQRSWLVQAHPRSMTWAVKFSPNPSAHASTDEIFGRLLSTWKEDTELSSSLTEILLNPAYQAIIGLGMEAVPLILRELIREPTHLGWALASITRENPVTEDMAGDVLAQAQAWISWGRLNGYC